MKPEKALEKLEKLVKKANVKDCINLDKYHIEADKILIELIQILLEEKRQKELGKKIAKAFDEIKKWYA